VEILPLSDCSLLFQAARRVAVLGIMAITDFSHIFILVVDRVADRTARLVLAAMAVVVV
jgi:hypothetical protein